MEMTKLLTTKETAAELRISLKTLYRILKTNQLEYVKIGEQIRVTRLALDQFIKANSTTTKGACQC